MRVLALGAALASALAVGVGVGGSVPSAICSASGLAGTFKEVPGSAGAGNISYKLRVVNHSGYACAFPASPVLRLLDKRGHNLPTHAKFPPTTIATITIASGKAAVATARFSPDVPGKGEPSTGPCEKVAHSLRVSLGGSGSVTAAVKPPTSVCEHGTMSFRAIHQGT